MTVKTIDPTTLPYRPCVGVMLINAEKQVFVARRIDSKLDAWQMPQGGIDEGETPEKAVKRELKEEIGTDHVQLLHSVDEWLSYDIPVHLIPKLWGGKYRGQTQKWFLARYLGADHDINIETEDPEFSDWRWEVPNRLPEIIVPFKRGLYQQVIASFMPHIETL